MYKCSKYHPLMATQWLGTITDHNLITVNKCVCIYTAEMYTSFFANVNSRSHVIAIWKTSSYRRNSVPYEEIGIKESNGDVRTLTGSS